MGIEDLSAVYWGATVRLPIAKPSPDAAPAEEPERQSLEGVNLSGRFVPEKSAELEPEPEKEK